MEVLEAIKADLKVLLNILISLKINKANECWKLEDFSYNTHVYGCLYSDFW